jgi:16S rRNA (guanine966-N2)-methyltransferase
MSAGGRGQLRIIGGIWRGRKLTFPQAETLRPTPDRIRETLFNWLRADVPGSRCLDLFAGSGALGFEAASRGAVETWLVERNAATARTLADNIRLLETDRVSLHRTDAIDLIGASQRPSDVAAPFDIIFIDPPYDASLVNICCERLEHGRWLSDHAKIYVEHAARDDSIRVPAEWVNLKSKIAGQVAYKLFSRGLEG